MDSAQESDLAPLFGDLSQNEKLSEIKPPLAGRCEDCILPLEILQFVTERA